MLMPATYEPIASTTLGSDTTDVTFSSIPGTYTDLRLVTSIIASSAAAIDVDYRFNGDTGTNFSWTTLRGDGGSAASARVSSVNYLRLGYAPGNASSTWSVGQVDVLSYANTNVFKTSLASGAAPANFVQRQVGLWRSTSAITSLTIIGAFKSGSTFSLYGIKAA